MNHKKIDVFNYSNLKGIISIILSLFILISLFPFDSFAASSDIVVKGKYYDSAVEKTLMSSATYSDGYFDKKSTKLQSGLAKLSILASSSTYKASYATSLMKKCGYKSESKTKNVTAKDNDHVSYVIGHKKSGKKTIVAVWVRGTSGNYEWVSNFNVGNGKTHEGFSKAEAELNSALEKYIKKNKIKGDVRFWLTGHSRGGAVANLLAVRLNKSYGKSKVYAYTFATPRVSTAAKSKGYENIYNFINSGDFVTEVAPSAWKYKRYGKDIILSYNKLGGMKKTFKNKSGEDYEGYTEAQKKALLKAFISYCGKNVNAYYTKKTYTTKPSFFFGTGGETFEASPADFCQKGIGYMFAGNTAEGLAYALKIGNCDSKAQNVISIMFANGGLSSGLAHAHCPTTYISWLNAMY